LNTHEGTSANITKIVHRISTATDSTESASILATKTPVVTMLNAFHKITHRNVNVQPDTMAMPTSDVQRSRDADRTVSVLVPKLVLMASALHPANAESTLSALSEIIKLHANVPLAIQETLWKYAVLLPTLVSPIHAVLTLSVNLTTETQSATVPRE